MSESLVLNMLLISNFLAFLKDDFNLFPILWKSLTFHQQDLRLQLPDSPWHRHTFRIVCWTICRPTWLLCMFIDAQLSDPSFLSKKALVVLMANLTDSVHPSQAKLSWLICPSWNDLFRSARQLQLFCCPDWQVVAIVWTKAALTIAWMKATSLVTKLNGRWN